jgi:radical SAM superfamily enzyme YgiQ (UPF0313 family)
MIMEKNTIIKDHRKVKLKFALVYPNIYNIGMSNLAIRLLYEIINSREDIVCERFFFSGYRERPRSVESGLPLNYFDVIGVSFQHEMDYIRFLDMLSSSSIPIEADKRNLPIIIAGGPAVSSNPMPLTKFIDFFVIGEVEPIINMLLDSLVNRNLNNIYLSIPGLYKPGKSTERIYIKNLDLAPHAIRQVISNLNNTFTSSFLLEVSRGCKIGCRFCLEYFLYFPKRERSFKNIARIIEDGLLLTQTNKLVIISSAFLDHSQIKDILSFLIEKKINFSVPSIRVSKIDDELIKLIALGGQHTLTIAPESHCEHLRNIINKKFDNDLFFDIIRKAKEAGIKSLKLYFMLGIPGEKIEDFNDLDIFLSRIISLGFSPSSIHISINPLIPKANTPFQWLPLISKEDYRERLTIFYKKARTLGIKRIESLDYRWCAIQAYLSTAGQEASELLKLLLEDIKAGGNGDLGSWRRVLRHYKKRPENIYEPRSIEEPLPWEEIKGAFPISILKKDFTKVMGDIE